MTQEKLLRILYAVIIIAFIHYFVQENTKKSVFFPDKHSETAMNVRANFENSVNRSNFEGVMAGGNDDLRKNNSNKTISENNANFESREIVVNYPINFSNKTRKEIFKLRKQYVSQSLFSNSNYEPSEDVFGQIEDNKPWMSVNICKSPQESAKDKYEPSEEARFIVNPTMLVAIEYPFYRIKLNNPQNCTSRSVMLLPKRIFYTKERNEITVVYSNLPILIANNSFYQFNGLNARDLGYSYFYVDTSKSTFNIPFTSSNNPSNEISQFQNFIHTGSSCGLPEGCNNGSPRQPSFEFTYRNYLKRQNAVIYIKLWKNYPKSVDSPADINEKIIFQNV